MFESLPKKYKAPRYFALCGFLLSVIIPVPLYLIIGDRVALFECSFVEDYVGACHTIVPTNEHEWGRFVGRTFVWVIAALLVYWWKIGRKKDV